ncbi:MAG: hypothetical protein ACFB8W_10845 [Elainellaceae cyanobacterium]
MSQSLRFDDNPEIAPVSDDQHEDAQIIPGIGSIRIDLCGLASGMGRLAVKLQTHQGMAALAPGVGGSFVSPRLVRCAKVLGRLG